MGVDLVPFAGRRVRSLACSVFDFAESVYPSGMRLPKHAHAEPYIGITLAGEWEQDYEDRTRQGKPWTITFHPAGEPHSNRFFGAGARILNIKITSRRLRQLLGSSLDLKDSIGLAEGKPVWIARNLYREFGRVDAVSSLTLNGLTLQLLAELLASSSEPSGEAAPEWLLRAREVIETHFAEQLHLKSIAATVGVHPVHLAREFRRRFHGTVGEGIRDLRIARACQLLAGSSLPLAQIALEVGFSDQASFTTAFHRRTGLRPSEFRRMNRPS